MSADDCRGSGCRHWELCLILPGQNLPALSPPPMQEGTEDLGIRAVLSDPLGQIQQSVERFTLPPVHGWAGEEDSQAASSHRASYSSRHSMQRGQPALSASNLGPVGLAF